MLDTQNVAVAVDLSKTDESVLKFTHFLFSKMPVKRMKMIHVIPSILAPGNADLELHQILPPGFSLKEKIKAQILEMNASMKNGIVAEVEILEGNPYQEFITSANDLGAGMIVVGRKKKSEGSGITARKIARKFSGNVLFIPEGASPQIKKIIVPTDFSENSARALRAAIELSEYIGNCSVRCVHIVRNISETYYLELKTRVDLDARFRENAKKSWKDFLEKNGFKKGIVPIDLVQNNQPNIADQLSGFLKKNTADLVVIGATGHTAFENFVYGSVTDNLLNYFDDCPICIVR